MTDVWFGTHEKMQWIKAMLSELPANSVSYSEQNNYLNGGAGVVRSFGAHREFDMQWSGTAAEVGLIKDYVQGLYGSGHIHMVLPHAMRSNVFSPNWAAPRLISLSTNDWPEIYDVPGIQVATASNSYNIPPFGMTYAITTPADTIPVKKFTIPIPPNKTLWLGWMGSATGAGVVRVRPFTNGPTYASASDLSPLSVTSSTRMNKSFDGSSYAGVDVYLTQTTATASTITVNALMGQLVALGGSPSSGTWLPGRGFTGMDFINGVSESIIQDTDISDGAYEHLTLNATLVEVGNWRNT